MGRFYIELFYILATQQFEFRNLNTKKWLLQAKYPAISVIFIYKCQEMKKVNIVLSIFLLISITFLNCSPKKLPPEKYHQYTYEVSSQFESDTFKIFIKNPLFSPLRFFIHYEDDTIGSEIKTLMSVTLNAKADTTLILNEIKEYKHTLKISSLLGSLNKEILPIELDLPFQEGKEYSIIQGNNSDFTHNTDYSRYALDFDMKTNDTICSSTDGFVVGVVDKYKYSGNDEKWTPFANFITIYDPNAGVFCQYVHLAENGSLVSIGDKVKRGQKIGLSGNTGRSTREHLHLNLLIPVDNSDGLKSTPIIFKGGIEGKNLKKGDKMKK